MVLDIAKTKTRVQSEKKMASTMASMDNNEKTRLNMAANLKKPALQTAKSDAFQTTLVRILTNETGMVYPDMSEFGTNGPTVVRLNLDTITTTGFIEDEVIYMLGVASVIRANKVAEKSGIMAQLAGLDKGKDTFAHVITSYGGDQPKDSILSEHPLMLYTMEGFRAQLQEYEAKDEVRGLVYPYIICHEDNEKEICGLLAGYSNIGFLLSVTFGKKTQRAV